MTHTLKTIQPYYDDVVSGAKPFEIRKNDRNFKIGDTLILQEFIDGEFTGSEEKYTIGYVLSGCPEFGLMEGFVILGLEEIIA